MTSNKRVLNQSSIVTL